MLDAMIAFSRAIYDAGINPERVEVSLPEGEWQALASRLGAETRKMKNETFPDLGQRGKPIIILGVRYVVRYGSSA